MAWIYYDPRLMVTPFPKRLIREKLDVPPGFGKLTGSAYYDANNRYVVLTPAVDGRAGWLVYDLRPPKSWYCRFEFWTGNGDGADAVYLSVYDDVYPTRYNDMREDIVRGGYHFTFDEYQSRMAFTKSTVDNGPSIAEVRVPRSYFMNGKWHVAEIWFWWENGKACCRMRLDNGVYELKKACDPNPQPNALACKGYIIFGGRTGGMNNEHRIRNIYFYIMG